MLQAWAEEEVHTEEGLEKFRTDMWLTLKEFEIALAKDTKGIELEMKFMEKRHQAQINHLKNNAAFRIEAMDSAMQEVKLKYQKQLNQA